MLPKYKTTVINGEEVKLYYIGEVARRLCRTPVTVRKWESEGIIPKAWFNDKNGRRLYTEEQVRLLVKYSRRYHIHHGKPIKSTYFSQHVFAEFEKLRIKYFKNEE